MLREAHSVGFTSLFTVPLSQDQIHSFVMPVVSTRKNRITEILSINGYMDIIKSGLTGELISEEKSVSDATSEEDDEKVVTRQLMDIKDKGSIYGPKNNREMEKKVSDTILSDRNGVGNAS